MSKKRVIIGTVVAAILATALVLLLTNNRQSGITSFATQTPDPVIETIKPTEAPTERITIRITNPPTETPTSVPPTPTPSPWKETEYPPTCEEAGYIVRENTVEGYTVIDEGKPALGHEYGEWKEDPDTGMMITTCNKCGKEIQSKAAYNGIIPRIDLIGNIEGISKSNRVILQFWFISPTEQFSCFSYTTWQGHNALNYPKKNYTIRLFDDEEITEKHKLTFKGWQQEHKYVLKANYKDASMVRNLIAASLWANMAETRPNLFDTLKYTSNYGAVDGFPVIVYLNGEFHGLYTLNLHIDDDLYQMDNEYDAVMIANSSEPDETRFHANAAFIDEKTAWEVEYCGTGQDNQWAKEKLNEFISFVMNSNDETFREHLGDYLDVDGAIDYLIFLYVTGLERNASKDLVLLKYHDCNVWIPTVYDMERAFGLSLDGSSYNDTNEFLPTMQDGVWDSGTDSLLWDRLLEMFETEVKDRYKKLRQAVLTDDEFMRLANIYLDQIPDEYYRMDSTLFPRTEPEERPKEQIKKYITKRLEVLDRTFIGGLSENVYTH